MSLLFGVDAGAEAGADGVAGAAVPVVESLVFDTSLLSDGFDSDEESEVLSEPFGA